MIQECLLPETVTGFFYGHTSQRTQIRPQPIGQYSDLST